MMKMVFNVLSADGYSLDHLSDLSGRICLVVSFGAWARFFLGGHAFSSPRLNRWNARACMR